MSLLMDSPSSDFEREALQARLCSALFSRQLLGRLTLKGGLALRLTHGSGRLTKDIDLDAEESLPVDKLQKEIRGAIAWSLKAGGFSDTRVSEPKQTATTLRWKISAQSPEGHLPIHLTVEVSRRAPLPGLRKESIAPKIETPGLPGALIQVYSAQSICAIKTSLFSEANRNAPKDTLDLLFLIEANIEPPVEILAQFPKKTLEKSLEELWGKLESQTWERFCSETLPSLALGAQKKILAEGPGYWDQARLVVGEKAESWLSGALSLQRLRDLGAPHSSPADAPHPSLPSSSGAPHG